MNALEWIRAWLALSLRNQAAPERPSRRSGYHTKRRTPNARKRKHLREIQKMSRVKNRVYK